MKTNPLHWLNDILSLIYPDLCAGCGEMLVSGEKYICTACKFQLPETGFHHIIDNPVEKHLWGRVDYVRAASLFYFNKGSMVQNIMHRLKYANRPEIGQSLGMYYGQQLKDIPGFGGLDYIVPVPLFPKKQHKRGYNQSAEFGKGLGKAMEIPLLKDGLVRHKPTSTQTKKSRSDRWENVEGVFELGSNGNMNSKSVLLIDDVITTGATLEACATVLKQKAGCSISVATIACAVDL